MHTHALVTHTHMYILCVLMQTCAHTCLAIDTIHIHTYISIVTNV